MFFIRFAGIINSINTDSAWKTRTLSGEKEDFKKVVENDFSKIRRIIQTLRDKVNDD